MKPPAGTPIQMTSRMPSIDVTAIGPVKTAAPPRPVESSVPGRREHALSAYFETMETFLAVQREFAAQFLTPPAEPTPSASEEVRSAEDWPLLGEVVEHVPGQRLTVCRTFDVASDLFLDDHRLSTHRISFQDRDLGGLPVMPLTGSLEIMAEAACALAPGHVVTELTEVLATRWITFESGRRGLRVEANIEPREKRGQETEEDVSSTSKLEVGCSMFDVQSDGTRVRVAIRDDEDSSGQAAFRPALVEAVVTLAKAYPAAPGAPAVDWRGERPCDWDVDAIYPDRLFHGLRLRAIARVDRWAENGSEGTITVLPRAGLFRDTTAPRFATDPVLLDAIGAVVGAWSAYETFQGVVPFPFRVERIRLYAPPLPEGATVRFRHVVTRHDADMASNDLYGIMDDGSLAVAITGWEDRFFTVTPAIHRVVHRTRDQHFSESLPVPEGMNASSVTARVTPAIPEDLFDAGFRIWETALAFCVLTREERADWMQSGRSPKRSREWLLGRVAAKDAVRVYLKERFGVCVAPADVRIETDDLGKPRATGVWEEWFSGRLDVSVAHSGLRAAAIAAPASCGGIGIDMELERIPSEHFVDGAFSESELVLLDKRGAARDTGLLRLWCAKEAVGKALGTGLLGNPRGIQVRDWDDASEWVELELTGQWLERFPEHRGRRVRVQTWTAEGCTFALCVGV